MNDPVQRFFRARVAVLPVVHIDTPAQAAEETVTALSTGAHGVFLISHGGGAQAVERATDEALQAAQRAGFASPWLGVNLLGHHPWRALTWLHARGAHHVRAVWSDHSGLVPEREAQEGVRSLADARAAVAPWAPLFFGGVAFKYQPEPRDLAAECDRMLAAGVDALTTSGPGTGEACDPAKVAAIRARRGPRGGRGRERRHARERRGPRRRGRERDPGRDGHRARRGLPPDGPAAPGGAPRGGARGVGSFPTAAGGPSRARRHRRVRAPGRPPS